MRTRCRLSVAVIWSVTMTGTAWVLAQTASDELQRGIGLFEQGMFAEAQQVLLAIDRDQLTDEQKRTRDKYVDEVRLAVNLANRARQDHEEAQRAFDAGDFHRADMLYAAVLRNKYADASLKESARKGQALIAEKKELEEAVQVAPPAPPRLASDTPKETADGLVAEAGEAMRQGRQEDAIRLFQKALDLQPGHPEATKGLEEARQHQVVAEQSGSMIDRTLAARQIQWQRTEATYRQLERDVHAAINASDFDLARQLALRARQVVETGRAFADPLLKYEVLRDQATALLEFVADQERVYHGQEAGRKRLLAEQQEQERRTQIEESRRRRVEALFDQALQLRREKRYEEAVQALRQITLIEPTNERAAWLQEDLESLIDLQYQARAKTEYEREAVRTLIGAEDSRIPYSKEVIYPKNWPEITERRQRFGATSMSESDLDRAVRRRLNEPVDEIQIGGKGLGQALEELRDLKNLNLHVNWPALAKARVTPETKVSAHLKNVRLEKVLTLLLEDAGGTEARLGFAVDEGVVTISTQADLNEKTVDVVYDVRDLLFDIPEFAAPSLELGELRQAAIADNRKLSWGDSLFPEESGEKVESGQTPAPKPAVQELLDLIRERVCPGTWREQGGTVGSLRELNGQLIVTHTSAAQRAIGGLLGQLRETRAVQIAVEARFIQVTSNFLEDLGINLNLILNQGNAGFDLGTVLDASGLPTAAIDPATGAAILVPREFSRLGFLPAPPITQGFGTPVNFVQPYRQSGLVPGTGTVAPHSGQTTPIPIISNILAIADPAASNTGVPGSFGGDQGLLNPALQISGSFLDNLQLDFLIRATQADSRSTTLQAPRLTLSNGQRAFIAVVTQTAYVSGLNAVVATEVGQLEPLVSTLNTGSVLDIEATVSADRRYVTLTVRAGLANLIELATVPVNQAGNFSTGVSANIQTPVVQLTTIRSTVTVPDNGTLLLGGLKLTGEVEREGGVPVLSKIPILKRLYTARSTVKDELVLLILIKPKIIIQPEAEEDAFPGLETSLGG